MPHIVSADISGDRPFPPFVEVVRERRCRQAQLIEDYPEHQIKQENAVGQTMVLVRIALGRNILLLIPMLLFMLSTFLVSRQVQRVKGGDVNTCNALRHPPAKFVDPGVMGESIRQVMEMPPKDKHMRS